MPTNDFIVDGIVENLAFFGSKICYIWYFQPNRDDNPMHGCNLPVSKTMQGLCVHGLCVHACGP